MGLKFRISKRGRRQNPGSHQCVFKTAERRFPDLRVGHCDSVGPKKPVNRKQDRSSFYGFAGEPKPANRTSRNESLEHSPSLHSLTLCVSSLQSWKLSQ